MTPLLDAILPWVRSHLVDASPVPNDARADDARMVRRVLTGEDGPALLTLLAKMSVLQPPLDPRLSGAASHDYAQRRTGANELFAALIFYRDLADALDKESHDARRTATDPDHPGDRAGYDERFGSDAFDPEGLIGGR